MANTYHRYKPDSEPVKSYRLLKLLGSGGFGDVWKASGPGGTEVAIKIIDLTGQQGEKEFESLKLVKKCSHPNLIPLHGYWFKYENGDITTDESGEKGSGASDVRVTAEFLKPVELIIAMGLGKKCLNKRLQEARDAGQPGIPAAELLDYMDGAARGIDYLNNQVGIVHGDIKPHNILVVGDAAAVCDFGLARAVETLRKTSMTPMTVAYAAPESFRGKPTIQSDQYSLAMTYVELRTGHLPFDEGLSPFDLMTTHTDGKLDLNRLPPYEREVIRRATHRNPDDRWNNNRDFARALSQAFDADPQAKLLPGSPFKPDHQASGFVATLITDPHPSGIHPRVETNKQTREVANHGVTPRSAFGLDSAGADAQPDAFESGVFAPQPSYSYEYPGEGEQPADETAATAAAKSKSSGMLIGAGAVLALLVVVGVVWAMSRPKIDEPAPPTLAQTSAQLPSFVDVKIAERQFSVALDEVERVRSMAASDESTLALTRQLSDRVRTAWVADARRDLDGGSRSNAQRTAQAIQVRFPQDKEVADILSMADGKSTAAPVQTASAVDSFLARADVRVRAKQWEEALQQLEGQRPSSLSKVDDERINQRTAEVQRLWLDDVNQLLQAGAFPQALTAYQIILGRYPTLYDARLQRIRIQLMNNNTSAAKADLAILAQAASLPAEVDALRKAFLVTIDLNEEKLHPEQAFHDKLYRDLRELTILNAPSPANPALALTKLERDKLLAARDQRIAADYKSLLEAPRTKDQLAQVDRLLPVYPARQYELRLIKSEVLVKAKQWDEARKLLSEAEKTPPENSTEKSDATARKADIDARRLIVDLHDPATAVADRDKKIVEAEKLQLSWLPGRRGDLGEALIPLAKADAGNIKPRSLKMLYAAVEREPLRKDLYEHIREIDGDRWTPSVEDRLNDPSPPTAAQWRKLYDDCVALQTLGKGAILYEAARTEAMLELDMPLDAAAKAMTERSTGVQGQAYILFVGARVAAMSKTPADKLFGRDLTNALSIPQPNAAMDAPFRRARARESLAMAARNKRRNFAAGAIADVLQQPYKTKAEADTVIEWLTTGAQRISPASSSTQELANLALARAFSAGRSATASDVAALVSADDADLGDDVFAVVGLDYLAAGSDDARKINDLIRMVRYFTKKGEDSVATKFYREMIQPLESAAKDSAPLNAELVLFFERFREQPWPAPTIDERIKDAKSRAGQAKADQSHFRRPANVFSVASAFALLALADQEVQPSNSTAPQYDLAKAAFDAAETGGDRQAKLDGWLEAARVADHLIQSGMTSASVLRLAAESHEKLAAVAKIDPIKHYRLAIEYYSQAISQFDPEWALLGRARTYIRAIAQVESRLNPEKVFEKNRFAVIDLAEVDLMRVIERNARDSEARRWFARLLQEQADARSADDHFAAAVELSRPAGPHLFESLRDWAENGLAIDDVDEVRKRTERFAVDSTPNEQVPQLRKLASSILGEVHYRQRRWAEAVSEFDAAVPPAKLDSAELADVALLMNRASIGLQLPLADQDSAIALAKTRLALADLKRAGELAFDPADLATIHYLAARHAMRIGQIVDVNTSVIADAREMGLGEAEKSLMVTSVSPESVSVRVVKLKLLIHRYDHAVLSAADKAKVGDDIRMLFLESKQMSEAMQMANELGQLLRIEDQRPELVSAGT